MKKSNITHTHNQSKVAKSMENVDVHMGSVTPRNLYRYKLEKIIMTGIYIDIS